MKLTSSQDRAAVGRWIEGQADRAEGRRILAALPRLARGEGWVWAPSDGVLERVSFPVIQTFDSSGTPRREQRVAAPGSRPPVDVAALAAALLADEPDSDAGDAVAHSQLGALEQRLRLREQELAVALARVARLEAALREQVEKGAVHTS